MKTYYKDQLKRLVDLNSEKSEFKVKLIGDLVNGTNYMDLNKESIPVLIKFLEKQLKKVAKNE